MTNPEQTPPSPDTKAIPQTGLQQQYGNATGEDGMHPSPPSPPMASDEADNA